LFALTIRKLKDSRDSLRTIAHILTGVTEMAINHLADIKRGTVTASNIRGIRMALNAAWRIAAGYSTSATTRYTAPLADEMRQAIRLHHPTVTGALHTSRLAILRSKRWRNRFTAKQLAIINDSRVRFDLVGWIDINGGEHVPVYRVIGFKGSFKFYNIPWQSAVAYGCETGPQVMESST